MPVSPDYMAYGNETDYHGQVAEWLKQERANLFERLAKLETVLREARQFVGDSGCDEDDSEINEGRNALLAEIDALL